MTSPPRPRVVVSMTASVDGRIALRRDDLLMHPPAAVAWAALQPPGFADVEAMRAADIGTRHGPQAELAGSGSLVVDAPSPSPSSPSSPSPPSPSSPSSPSSFPPGDDPAVYDDFVVSSPGREKWFAVVDGRGRVRWTMKRVGTSDLLVLACRSTPSGYLAHLRREGISYLVAGESRVDLAAALQRMRSRLGVTCVVSTGGGGLNGALLRAGLVDEVQVVVLPAVIGGLGTPTLFDGPPLEAGESPLPLRLLSAQASADGTLWIRYQTDRPETATEEAAGG